MLKITQEEYELLRDKASALGVSRTELAIRAISTYDIESNNNLLVG